MKVLCGKVYRAFINTNKPVYIGHTVFPKVVRFVEVSTNRGFTKSLHILKIIPNITRNLFEC